MIELAAREEATEEAEMSKEEKRTYELAETIQKRLDQERVERIAGHKAEIAALEQMDTTKIALESAKDIVEKEKTPAPA